MESFISSKCDIASPEDLDAQRNRLNTLQAQYADVLADIGLTARALHHCMPTEAPGFDVTVSTPFVYTRSANTDRTLPGLEREEVGVRFTVRRYVEGRLASERKLKVPVADVYNESMAFPITDDGEYTDRDAMVVSGMAKKLRAKAASGELSALSSDCTNILGY